MKIRKISVKLITYLTLFVLVLIMAVGSAFSWYDRTNDNETDAVKLNYSLAGSRVNYLGGLDIVTKIATDKDNNGILEYDDDIGTSVSLKANKVQYFKTTIDSNKSQFDSCLASLYISEIQGSGLYLGVYSPEKTYTENISGKDICIADYLYVPAFDDTDGNTLEVIWYIGSATTQTVNLGTPYLRYN